MSNRDSTLDLCFLKLIVHTLTFSHKLFHLNLKLSWKVWTHSTCWPLCLAQCTITRSSTGTSNPPTCCWGTMVTSKSQTSEWATSSRGRTPSCRARRGRRPSWLQRWWPSTRTASAERWDKTETDRDEPPNALDSCLIVRNEELMSKRPLRALMTTVFVYQALDVWAMGVTLYCFVIGKVSRFTAKWT